MKEVKTLEEFVAAAREFASALAARADKAVVVSLSGELGAGKTTFTQSVAKEFGIEESITSPTFIIEKVYELPQETRGFRRLVHIDAYRLESDRELEILGWHELVRDPQTLVLIEWPEKIAGVAPDITTAIQIALRGEVREISIEPN